MPLPKSVLVSRAKKIRLVAMDIDGVLTNGDVLVLESGEEVKAWNAKDRLVLALLRDSGNPLTIAWITGRSSNSVVRSALDLGIPHVIQKCSAKKAALEKILLKTGISISEAAYIGDDIIDLPVMNAVGFAACPADAVTDVKRISHYVSPLEGGRGVVRDVLEFVLRAQKKWDDLLSPFLR